MQQESDKTSLPSDQKSIYSPTGKIDKPPRSRGKVDLLESEFVPSLIKFALPLTLSFLVNMCYALIDRWFISHLGTNAIAAIGLGEQLNFLVFTLGSGFGMGTGVIVARRVGEGDKDGAERTATQALLFMLVITLVLTVLLKLALPGVLARFGMNVEVTTFAESYLSAILIGFSANLLSFQINAIVRSSGNVMYPTIVLLITTVLNAIFAPILIFVFNLGMYGAGLATALAQISGAILNIVILLSGKSGIHIRTDHFRFDPTLIYKVASLGFPSSVQMLAVSLTRVSIFKLVAGFGTSVMAAYTLGISVDFVVFMFVFSVGISVEVATGQNLGAGKFERVHGYHLAGMKILSIVIAVLGIAIYLFGSFFTGLYTNDSAVIAETQRYFHVSVFGYFFFAVGIVSARVISGAGAAYLSLFIVAGSIVLLQLPLVYVLSQFSGWNQNGIWIGAAGGYALFAGIAYYSFLSRRWLKARV